MNTDKELMQQAFDAMSYGNTDEREAVRVALRDRLAQPEQSVAGYCKKIEELIAERDSLRAALAQPEQEPVASIGSLNEFTAMELVNRGFALTDYLYTTQPQRPWVDLTDEDVMGLCRTFMGQFDKTKFIKATEAKLKEQNNG
jgi:hypothetical protein